MAAFPTSELAWCECNGRIVVLDIAADRYFQMREAHRRSFLAQAERTGPQNWHQPEELPRPRDWLPPRKSSPSIDEGPFQLPAVAAAIWTQRRVERRLATQSFRGLLLDFRQVRDRRTVKSPNNCDPGKVIRAFEHARLLRSAATRCLPRSVALALRLASQRVRALVVIGVKSEPFGAHCWVQSGDTVLSDSIEETLRYTPILVV